MPLTAPLAALSANPGTLRRSCVPQLAITAAHHSVPFYVAAPATSIDLQLPGGDKIPIEERPAAELLQLAGQRVAAQGEMPWGEEVRCAADI